MIKKLTQQFFSLSLLSCAMMSATAVAAEGSKILMDPRVTPVPYDDSFFSSDPDYDLSEYDVEKQLEIYGGKAKYDVPRPLLELGRRIYDVGPFSESSYIFGRTNPMDSQLVVYGDWRTAVASNDNQGFSQSQVATRLNLDIDWKLTGTERLHATITPLEKDGRFTRSVLSSDDGITGSEIEIDGRLDALYFEGDMGNIVAGFSNTYSTTDMPFAIGLMPLLFQNGVWFEDAFVGIAASIPHMNSPSLDISNMDLSFFIGFDDVSTVISEGDEGNVTLFGMAAFVEANQGYWEAGYGFTDNSSNPDLAYHNLTVSFTKRYGSIISNSIRVITNFGQAANVKTADGTLILIENSYITSKPSTLIPYFNFFIGDGSPQSLARAAAAGGVLRNTGINFETDGLTGFPTLTATGQDAIGGAVGVQYLFALDQQIVVEFATVLDQSDAGLAGDEMGFGVRYQKPLDRKWLVRADAMFASRDVGEDSSGVRFEIRRKF